VVIVATDRYDAVGGGFEGGIEACWCRWSMDVSSAAHDVTNQLPICRRSNATRPAVSGERRGHVTAGVA